MRIGIDARKAADYGIGTYIRNLTAHLVRQSPESEWVFFHRPGEADLLPGGENVTLVPDDSGTYSLVELLALSAKARRYRLDLFHAPHYTLPFHLPCPAVVTIHDLIHLLFREYLPHVLARHYARYMIGRAVKESTAIITVSHSTERDLRRFFPEACTALRVIPNGVDDIFTPRPLPEVREWLSHSLDLKGDYLLFVGNPKKHKNLDLLLRAFSRLQSSYPDLELVVVGGGEEDHARLAGRARTLGVNSGARFFGRVDPETLALLYSAATVFVFPSRYEGFGLPPLEAMACGAPVAASTSSSIPEVLGPAAAYFSPDSTDSLTNALCGLLDNPERRSRLIRIGLSRSRLFSWDEAARRTMLLYRSAGGGNPMRTAIVHDWLTGMRGGEKCLEVMCELFPGATLFTLIYRRGHLSPTIEAMKIRTSWIQGLPGRQRYYRHLLPLFPSAVESFDLSEFDLVISSSHCVAKGAVTGRKTLHLCYCYTPMRYAWDQYEHYFGAHRLRWWGRAIVPPLIQRLRRWDTATADRVQAYAAISGYVAERIKSYYGRESTVIHPPVDMNSFTLAPSPGDYYLMVNALAPYKRVDIAIEAFNALGLELRIVGTGQDRARLEQLARDNVRFLGWVSPADLAREYAGCRGLVFPGEEDFGITPVEAQACGRPVIAYGRGGVRETVRPHPDFPAPGSWPDGGEGPTGVFFTSQDVPSLIDAVRFHERHVDDFSPPAIRRAALPFDRPRFKSQFTDFVEEQMKLFTGHSRS